MQAEKDAAMSFPCGRLGTVIREQMIYSYSVKNRLRELFFVNLTQHPSFGNAYATFSHHIWHTIGSGRTSLALVVEIAFWQTAGRYHYRARKFPALLSADHRPAGVVVPIVSAVVVVEKMIG